MSIRNLRDGAHRSEAVGMWDRKREKERLTVVELLPSGVQLVGGLALVLGLVLTKAKVEALDLGL